MRKINTVLIVACAAMLQMLSVPAMAQEGSAKPAGLKTLAIGAVETGATLSRVMEKSGKLDALKLISESMDARLMDRLHNTRKFELHARTDLRHIIEEQGLGKAGELTGCQYLLVLSINEFQDHTAKTTVRAGVTRLERTIQIGMVAKIYDAQTQAVLETASISFPLVSEAKPKLSNMQEDGELTDSLRGMIAGESAHRIANRVIDVLYPARVISRNGQEVTINRGDGSYAAAGQVFTVRGPDKVETDPDTGVDIKIPGPVLGKIRFKEVLPLVSIADVVEEPVAGQIAKGARLTLIAVESASVSPPSATPPPAPAPVIPAPASAAVPAAQGPISIAVFRVSATPSVEEAMRNVGRESSLKRVIQGLEPLLRQRLGETGRFKVIASADMPVLDEWVDQTNRGNHQKAAALFNKSTPQYIILVSFNDFQDQEVTQERPSLGTIFYSRTIRAAAVATIYDGATGDEKVTVDVPIVNTFTSNMRAGAGKANVEGGASTDAMLLETATKAATAIAGKLAPRLSSITVLDRTGTQVTLNLGGALMLPGQFWSVTLSKQVFDPNTGKMETIPGARGVIQIQQSLPRQAVAQIYEEPAPGAITAGWALLEPMESYPPQQPAAAAK